MRENSPRRTVLRLLIAAGAVALTPLRAVARQLPAFGDRPPLDRDDALAELIGEALDSDSEMRAEIIDWLAAEHLDECREALGLGGAA
jgi:hypothetical protein